MSATVRPILDTVQKQGVLRIFHHGLVRLGTLLYQLHLIKNNFIVKENINNNLRN